MYKFLKTYLPALSISFTFIILFAAVNNILNGYTKEGFCVFTLQVTGYLIISMLIDHAVSIINFKKYIHHLIAETVILYPITLVSAWIGGWFRISLFNIVFYISISRKNILP